MIKTWHWNKTFFLSYFNKTETKTAKNQTVQGVMNSQGYKLKFFNIMLTVHSTLSQRSLDEKFIFSSDGSRDNSELLWNADS